MIVLLILLVILVGVIAYAFFPILGGESDSNIIDSIVRICSADFPKEDRKGNPVYKQYVEYMKKALKDALDGVKLKPRWYITDIPHTLPWEKKIRKLGHHHGQKKLFLNEIQFLSNLTYEPDVVIYAGAAEGNKNYLIWKMFTKMKYILIDPAPFRIFLDSGKEHYKENNKEIVYLQFGTFGRLAVDGDDPKSYRYINIFDPDTGEVVVGDVDKIKGISSKFADNLEKNIDKIMDFVLNSGYKMFIINGYLTSDISLHLGKFNSCFISDIRTTMSSDRDGPGEGDIIWNAAQTVNWLHNMKPRESMLKLRIPWFDNEDIKGEVRKFAKEPYVKADLDEARDKWGIDFVGNFEEGKFVFFSGDILIQPFAPMSSTETRLIVKLGENGEYELEDLQKRSYGGPLQYFNAIERSFCLFENPNADLSIGFDYCADCSLENEIFQLYVDKYGGTVLDCVKKLNSYTLKSRYKYHGNIDSINVDDIKKRYYQYTNPHLQGSALRS